MCCLFVIISFPSLAGIGMKMLKRERRTAQYCQTLNVMVTELLGGMVFHVSGMYLWLIAILWHQGAIKPYCHNKTLYKYVNLFLLITIVTGTVATILLRR